MVRYLRIKATSNCMSIRRSIVTYVRLNEGDFCFETKEYPLNKVRFKVTFINDKYYLIIDDEKYELVDGYENSFMKQKNVQTLDKKDEIEYLHLQVLPLTLSMEAVSFYEKAISNGEWFDENPGEFEYLLGLIYENENQPEKAKEYYLKSKQLKFIK